MTRRHNYPHIFIRIIRANLKRYDTHTLWSWSEGKREDVFLDYLWTLYSDDFQAFMKRVNEEYRAERTKRVPWYVRLKSKLWRRGAK